MSEFYSVTEYRENIYRITSDEGCNMDLLVGKKKALLIDTGYGFGDLRSVVDGITSLPLTVVNTHGHLDHANGNYQFADCEIYMNPGDFPVYEKYYTQEERKTAVERGRHTIMGWGSDVVKDILPPDFQEDVYVNAKKPEALPLREGMKFDLGGIELEVYEVPGHTWGSVALLNPATGDLYIGDAANAFVVVCLDGANVPTYHRTLLKLKEMEFENFLQGHGLEPIPKTALENYLDCVEHMDEVEHEEAESPFHKGRVDWIFRRPGFAGADMGKPGYAQLVTDPDHMKE